MTIDVQLKVDLSKSSAYFDESPSLLPRRRTGCQRMGAGPFLHRAGQEQPPLGPKRQRVPRLPRRSGPHYPGPLG